jgi:hypothetical protein
MITTRAGYCEGFQRRPDMGIAWMRMVAITQELVDFELFLWVAIARIDFQSNVFMRSNLLVFVHDSPRHGRPTGGHEPATP